MPGANLLAKLQQLIKRDPKRQNAEAAISRNVSRVNAVVETERKEVKKTNPQ